MMKNTILTVGCLSVVLAIAVPAFSDEHEDYYERYRDYKGYKERPYDRGRHYGYHHHRDHRYHYRGHWRSWNEWDHYARKHPDVRRHGRYYYDGPHLMFRSCPPETNSCIFFSIGR